MEKFQQISGNPKISINPLIDYVYASEKKKASIINGQKNPSDFIVARYRTPRAAFSKYFIGGYDVESLSNAINRLQSKTITSDWQRDDTMNSIEALRHFLQIAFPFENIKCTFIRPEKANKAYEVEGVEVIVAPDLLIQWENNGKKILGAIKFNIKKQNISLQKGRLAATVIYDYLKMLYSSDYEIDPNYCIYVDVMNERTVVPDMIDMNLNLTKEACKEIKLLWTKAS